MRRLLPSVIALAVVLLALVGYSLLTAAKWSGGKTLGVEVLVIDTDALRPVPGAQVTIFSGPRSPLEGSVSWRKQADFLPDPESKDTETRLTDSEGRCSFKYRFGAAGSNDFLRHSGSVDTSSVWLRVAASDRPTTLVPLDRQSVRHRDFGDDSPLVVTVVLNQCPQE